MPIPKIVSNDSTQTHNPSRFNDATIKAYGDSFAGMHQKGLWDDYELPAIANTPVPGDPRGNGETPTWKDYMESVTTDDTQEQVPGVPGSFADSIKNNSGGVHNKRNGPYGIWSITSVDDLYAGIPTIDIVGAAQAPEKLIDLMIQLYDQEITAKSDEYDETWDNLVAILNCMELPYLYDTDNVGFLYYMTDEEAAEINQIIKDTGILDKFYDYLNGKSWEESGLNELFGDDSEEYFINNMLLYANPDDLGEGYSMEELPQVKQKLLGMLDKESDEGIYSLIDNFDKLPETQREAICEINQLKMGKYNAEIFKKLYPFLQVQADPDFEKYLARDYTDYSDLPNDKYLGYLQQEEIATYAFLYETVSSDRAQEYIDAMQDTINQRIGITRALAYVQNLNELSDFGLIDVFYADAVGLGDGVRNFCDGVFDSMAVDGEISVFEYETMFKMSLLSENNEFNKNLSEMQRKELSYCYQTFQSVGNMLIPAAVSFIPGVGKILGPGLFFVSITGNSAESAAQRGLSVGKSYLYGAISGLSETMSEVFLGGIVGLSGKTGLKALFGEFEEEFFQEWFGGIMDSIFFHEAFDLDATIESSLYAGCQGMLVAGIMQGGSAIALSAGDVALSFTDSEFTSMAELLHSLDVKFDGKVLNSQMISGIMQLDDSNPLKKYTTKKIQEYVKDLTPADLAYLSENLSNNPEVKGMTIEQFDKWLKSLSNEQLCKIFLKVGQNDGLSTGVNPITEVNTGGVGTDSTIPTIDQLKTGLDQYDAQYGEGSGIVALFEYIYGSGDINAISNSGNLRAMLNSFGMDKVSLLNYYNQICSERAADIVNSDPQCSGLRTFNPSFSNYDILQLRNIQLLDSSLGIQGATDVYNIMQRYDYNFDAARDVQSMKSRFKLNGIDLDISDVDKLYGLQDSENIDMDTMLQGIGEIMKVNSNASSSDAVVIFGDDTSEISSSDAVDIFEALFRHNFNISDYADAAAKIVDGQNAAPNLSIFEAAQVYAATKESNAIVEVGKIIANDSSLTIIDALNIRQYMIDFGMMEEQAKAYYGGTKPYYDAKAVFDSIAQDAFSGMNPYVESEKMQKIRDYFGDYSSDPKVLLSKFANIISIREGRNANRTLYKTVDDVAPNLTVNLYGTDQTALTTQLVILRRAYNMIPENMRQYVQTINIYDVPNPADSCWAIDYNDMTEPFTSAATGGAGEINIWAPSLGNSALGLYSTICHEIGHNIDTKLGSIDPNANQTVMWTKKEQAWRDAMNSDFAFSGRQHPTEYASKDIVEDFAESVKLYNTNPKYLSKYFPERYRIIDSILSP